MHFPFPEKSLSEVKEASLMAIGVATKGGD